MENEPSSPTKRAEPPPPPVENAVESKPTKMFRRQRSPTIKVGVTVILTILSLVIVVVVTLFCVVLRRLDYESCTGTATSDNSPELFVKATVQNVSLLMEDVTFNTSLTLHGVDADAFHKDPTTSTQYQPVLVANHTYRLTWNTHLTPDNVRLAVYNLPPYDAKL